MKPSRSTVVLVLALLLSSCARGVGGRIDPRGALPEGSASSSGGAGDRPATPTPGSSGTGEAGGPIHALQEACFGGGCFWCIEAVFSDLQGVRSAVSGYAGGTTANPTYEQVCSGRTEHAEVVKVTFDPAIISYRQLLDVFFAVHDPTTLDRQGADVGSQYRSVIFYTSEAQRKDAEEARRAVDVSGEWGRPAVTDIEPLVHFYPAEAYHQGYYAANSRQPYCQVVISPKMAKLHKRFRSLLKTP